MTLTSDLTSALIIVCDFTHQSTTLLLPSSSTTGPPLMLHGARARHNANNKAVLIFMINHCKKIAQLSHWFIWSTPFMWHSHPPIGLARQKACYNDLHNTAINTKSNGIPKSKQNPCCIMDPFLHGSVTLVAYDVCNIEKVGGSGDEAMTLEPSSSTSTILPTIKTSPHHWIRLYFTLAISDWLQHEMVNTLKFSPGFDMPQLYLLLVSRARPL